MAKQTLFEQRKAMNEMRANRKARGICTQCGEHPVGNNRDGSKSVRCELCAKRGAIAKEKYIKAKVVSEWGFGDDFGYLDGPRFSEYAETVKKVIYKSDIALSIADMRRAMGENFVDRMHIDALQYLVADGGVRDFQSGALTRYEPAERHDREARNWHSHQPSKPPSDKTYPVELLTDNKRRVTA